MTLLSIHRKDQWDLECDPIICVHFRSRRVFCLWVWGVQIGRRRWTADNRVRQQVWREIVLSGLPDRASSPSGDTNG